MCNCNHFVFHKQAFDIFQHLRWFDCVLWLPKPFSTEENFKMGLKNVQMTSEIGVTAC